MATTSDIKNGLCLIFNHDIYQITEFQHVKPGKGAAFVRTKMKSITTGKVLDNTFPAGHKIETARIERHHFQYLYTDDLGYHFMNNETYEQTSLQEPAINAPQYLMEGMAVSMLFHSEKNEYLSAELPTTVEVEVTYTEPGVKGDTATNTLKPATVETGTEVNVPLFINTGDRIKVNTADNSYSERVKS